MENFTRWPARQVWALAGILFSVALAAQAQCPQASFTLPDTVCLGEPVNIANTSTGAVRYEWDFCSGDLEKKPTVQEIATIPGGNIVTGITTVFDGTNWFGFVCNRNANQIVRLDFGISLENTPTTTNLGNVGGLLRLPTDIVFRQENGNWYALVVNIASNASPNRLLRLNFGGNLANVPSATNLTNVSSVLNSPRDIELVDDNGRLVALALDFVTNRVSIIRFGNSIANDPQMEDIITTDRLPASGNIIGFSMIKSCGNWHGFVTDLNSKLYRLDFGANPFSLPAINDVTSISVQGIANLGKIKILYDSKPVGFLLSLSGKVYRLDFGNDLLQKPVASAVEMPALFNDTDGIDIASSVEGNYMFITDFGARKLFKLTFPNSCASSDTKFSQQTTPSSVSYVTGGIKKITLKAYNANHDLQLFTDSIFVRPQATADFSTASQCTGQPVTFSAKPPAQGNRIASYSWDFGDGVPVAGASVQRTFGSAATYSVTLAATDICGKTVTNTQAVRISRPSVADFTFPAAACSNQTLAFADASTVFDDPTVKWQWNFGDGGTSAERNPNYTFTKSGAQTVTLTITGQSGCQTNVVRQVNLTEGASVGFSISQLCLGSPVQLKDETVFSGTGTFASRTWDFGDNSPASAEANPARTYAQPGNYLVKLAVRNNLGCTVSKTQTITIRQLPKAAFAAVLACSGEAAQFSDASLANDGTIAQWQWDFGDAGSGANNVSAGQNPTHRFANPGTYQVKLRVTTDFGCSSEITQAVTVLAAPQAAFATQADCNRREVSFTDQSQPPAGGSLTGWYWEFGDNSTPSTDRNPRHTYAQPGSYAVRLTVTAASRCTNTLQQAVAAAGISVTIDPDTTVCAGIVTFAAKANAGGETIKAWQWDFGTLGKFTTAQPTVTVPADATALDVRLSVSTESGCSASVMQTVPVRQSPTARFFADPSAGNPLSYVFSNRSANASRYEWNFGDGSRSTDANPVHTYASPGILSVVLKSFRTNGCQTANAQVIAVGTGSRNGLMVFPNPVAAGGNQTVRLAFSLPRKQPVSFEVLDLAGRNLQKTTIENTKDDLNVVLLSDVFPQYASCAKGLYLVTVTYGQTIRVGKLIIL